MKLKKLIILQIRHDKGLRDKLIDDIHISIPTLYNWLRKNDRLLTTAESLFIISEHLNIPTADLIEKA